MTDDISIWEHWAWFKEQVNKHLKWQGVDKPATPKEVMAALMDTMAEEVARNIRVNRGEDWKEVHYG